jgi:hypothetical protein
MTAAGWFTLATLVTAVLVLSTWFLVPLAILAVLCTAVEVAA